MLTKKEKKMKVSKIADRHLEERCRWLNDPAVYKHMNMLYPITIEETKKWHERIMTSNARIDLVFEDTDNVVAMTGLTGLDLANGLVEFYIMVNPDFQGKGIGKTATIFTINWAFANYNIHKVYLYTNDFNERANKLYKRLGFELEGTLREHKFKNGKMIDRCIYGLLRRDWFDNEHATIDIQLDL